jgi:hypothetical protein
MAHSAGMTGRTVPESSRIVRVYLQSRYVVSDIWNDQTKAPLASGHDTAAQRSVMNCRRLIHLVGGLLKMQRHVEAQAIAALRLIISSNWNL